MRPNLVVAAWLALASLQASSAPFDNHSGHGLEGRQATDTAGGAATQASQGPADPPATSAGPAPGATSLPSPAGGGSVDNSSPTAEQPTIQPTAPAEPVATTAPPAEPPAPSAPSEPAGGATSVTQPAPNPPATTSEQAAPTPVSSVPAPATSAEPAVSPPAPPALSEAASATSEAPPPVTTLVPSPPVSSAAPPPATSSQLVPTDQEPSPLPGPSAPASTFGVAPTDLLTADSSSSGNSEATGSAVLSASSVSPTSPTETPALSPPPPPQSSSSAAPSVFFDQGPSQSSGSSATNQGGLSSAPANPSSSESGQVAAGTPTPTPSGAGLGSSASASGSTFNLLPTDLSDSAISTSPTRSGTDLPPPPPPTSTASSAPPALTPHIGSGGGTVDTCTTSTGLKGTIGPAGCFADKGQKCTVSDGIPGEITDNGVCSPTIGIGASCTLPDGSKGTAQLQALGTSLSCIGSNLAAGSLCSLPFSVAGSLESDGTTCSPPKTPPPAGNACPVPGPGGLGKMQSDGKTCLPPIESKPTGNGGTGSSGDVAVQCASAGQAGVVVNGACQVRAPAPGDPCYRGGGGAYLSNALPDGIFAADGKTCLVVNDTCSDNSVQGRYSPSYNCVVPPPTSGNPQNSGDACARDGMWGGKWDASSSTCILPGDPCSAGIYGPNAVDCIPKPPTGSGCKTAQGYNGTYNVDARCEAIVRLGERTPCLSVYNMAGAVSRGNGTKCLIPPNPDIPDGILQGLRLGSYCSNGRDSGLINQDFDCVVNQRLGGINNVPRDTPGNPHGDVGVITIVTKKSSPNWIPGVAAAGGVVFAAIILGLLAKKCGWFKACSRRKNRAAASYGPGGGILEEPSDEPQPTYPSTGGYDYTERATAESPVMSSNRLSIVSAPSHGSTSDPYGQTSYQGLQSAWNHQNQSAYMGSPPGSPPTQPNDPLLYNYSSPSATSHGWSDQRGPSPPYEDPRNPFR